MAGVSRSKALRLGERSVVEVGEGVLIFPWIGTVSQHTLSLLLNDLGLKASVEGLCITVEKGGPETIEAALVKLCEGAPPSDVELAETIEHKTTEKHHPRLTEELLTRAYASSRLDVTGALAAARLLLDQLL